MLKDSDLIAIIGASLVGCFLALFYYDFFFPKEESKIVIVPMYKSEKDETE